MVRISPRQLRWPIELPSQAPDSWRSDAFDPEVDGDDFTARPSPAPHDRTLPIYQGETFAIYDSPLGRYLVDDGILYTNDMPY